MEKTEFENLLESLATDVLTSALSDVSRIDYLRVIKSLTSNMVLAYDLDCLCNTLAEKIKTKKGKTSC